MKKSVRGKSARSNECLLDFLVVSLSVWTTGFQNEHIQVKCQSPDGFIFRKVEVQQVAWSIALTFVVLKVKKKKKKLTSRMMLCRK